MNPDSTICESDARAMVRLLGETVAVPGGHAEKKRFLMEGLCRLVGADSWVWTLSCQTTPGAQQTYVGFLHGGFGEERFARYLEAVENPEMGPIAARFFERLSQPRPVTMRRTEIDPENRALLGETGRLWAAADIGPLVMSAWPLDENSATGIAVFRRLHAPVFTEREATIIHIILSEVPWLRETGWPRDHGATVPKLYPRQRIVLNLLLDGLSRKHIASHLNISVNTVAGYVKAVYRHFSVNSQPELMQKFMKNDSKRM